MKILNHTPIKLVLVIFGYILWKTFLIDLVGEEATYGAFLIQGIYCRLRYFRDKQFFGSADDPVDVHPEVVEWTDTNTIH